MPRRHQGTKLHKDLKINADYKKLRNKLEVFSAVQDGLVELKAAKREGKELQTLSDFLNERN